MAYKIENVCLNCGACASVCPVSAISPGELTYKIDPDLCLDCGACSGVCPVGAISHS